MNYFEKDKYKFSKKYIVTLDLEEIVEKREEEIGKLKEELEEYKIFIKDLAQNRVIYPTRNSILNIAYFISENKEILDILKDTKNFPEKELLDRTPVKKLFLEKWKQHIIFYVLILSNSNYEHIRNYIKIVESSEVSAVDEISDEFKNSDEYCGIALDRGLRSAIIITSEGEFIRVSITKYDRVGQYIISKKARTIRDFKIHIAILAAVIIIFGVEMYYQYEKVDKSIFIETTSPITIEVNKFNKVVDAYSRTEKGKAMLDTLKLKNSKVDDSLKEILSYAKNNEMILDTGTLITVTGNPLKDTSLTKTEDFIKKEKLSVKFNDSGSENKVSY